MKMKKNQKQQSNRRVKRKEKKKKIKRSQIDFYTLVNGGDKRFFYFELDWQHTTPWTYGLNR